MANFQLNSKKTGSLALWVIIGLAGAALGWALAALTIMKAGGQPLGWWPEAWRYYDTNLPMISSADGFFFMHQAQVALDNGFANIPPFSKLTAAVSMIFSKPVEWTAFYMSLFFHLALGLLAVAWGRMLNASKFCTFLACVAIALIPAWLERGGPGRFDTDLPIVLFWQLGLFFLVKLGIDLNEKKLPFKNLIFALISFIALGWFWISGIGLALGSIVVWFFIFLPLRFLNIKTRIIVGIIFILWFISLIVLPAEKTLAPTNLVNIANDYFKLAFRIKTEIFYSSIKELYPLTFLQLMEKIGGSFIGGIVILAVSVLAAFKIAPLRLPVLLGIVCIFAGLRSNRLVYFGAYILALSIGFFPMILSRVSNFKFYRLTCLTGFIVFLGILYSCINWAVNRDLDIRWEKSHDHLIDALRHQEDKVAYLWNWWDDGYFLSARVKGMKPLFDGGSQTHVMAYIAARPFMMEDRRAAARWMRFFAIRGENGIYPLIKVWGESEAWNKLDFLISIENVEERREEFDQLPGGSEWIFPKGKVYWYMPSNFLKISNWWIALGLSRNPDKTLIRPHIEKIARDKFLYDESTKTLTITQELWDRGYKNFGIIYNTSQNQLSSPWPSGRAPYIVYSDKNFNAYITDDLGIKSLPLYMIVPGGENLPNFYPLKVDFNWGGVWEILYE